jgi:acyl carrier protein
MASNPTRPQTAGSLTPDETIIRDYILREVLYDKVIAELGPEDSLLQTELLDSIAIMQIVAFCEQAFQIEIPDEELLPDHFENVRAIGQLVKRQLLKKATSQ